MRKIKLIKRFYFLSLILITTLTCLYIVQQNHLVRDIYLIQNYQKKIKSLNVQNKYLEIEFAKKNSLDNILTNTKEMGFEKIEKINYIRIVDSHLAKRQE